MPIFFMWSPVILWNCHQTSYSFSFQLIPLPACVIQSFTNCFLCYLLIYWLFCSCTKCSCWWQYWYWCAFLNDFLLCFFYIFTYIVYIFDFILKSSKVINILVFLTVQNEKYNIAHLNINFQVNFYTLLYFSVLMLTKNINLLCDHNLASGERPRFKQRVILLLDLSPFFLRY